MSAASALARGRAAAEALMRDSCVITSTAPGAWDDATGTYGAPSSSTVYSGPCRMRMPQAAGARVEAGDASWAVDDAILSLPVAGSQAVAAGMTAVVTLSNDPMTTVTVTVQATHVQTDSTARRLPVKVVARDA